MSTTFAFSQNYLSIKTDASSYYFEQTNQSVFPIRIDSVKTYGDSTDYYSFCMIRPLHNNSLYTLKGSSWIGKKMVDCGNGINLFFNFNNDTIYIKTNALLNQTWRFYTYANGNYINATISNYTNENFLGLSDSVKTISIQVKDQYGNNITNNVNNYQLKLSKNFGFIQIFDFYDFPANSGSMDIYSVSNYVMELIGLSNPLVGWQNITLKDVYSMVPGDEIQLIRNYYQPNYGTNNYWIVTEKTINKYLARVENLNHDTVAFTIDKCFWRKQQYYPNLPSFITTHDTIVEKFALIGEFDKLPLEPIYSNSEYGYYVKLNSYGFEPSMLFHGTNDTVQAIQFDGWNYVYFNRDLGNTYIYDGFMGYSNQTSYNYYNVNGNIYGSSFIFICDSLMADTTLGIVSLKLMNNISFYPNPASNYIEIISNINNIQNFNLEIFDLQGRLLKSELIKENQQVINISELQEGLFIVKISNQNNSENFKLIISR